MTVAQSVGYVISSTKIRSCVLFSTVRNELSQRLRKSVNGAIFWVEQFRCHAGDTMSTTRGHGFLLGWPHREKGVQRNYATKVYKKVVFAVHSSDFASSRCRLLNPEQKKGNSALFARNF